MVAFLKKTQDSDAVNLDRFRHKKRWRWLWAIAAVVMLLIAWYVTGLYRAYYTATVKNTSTDTITKISQSTEPINVLLIGIEGANYPGGQLSDSIMVASIDAKAKTVSLLSLPRDLYVAIPGYGKDKINAAHSNGEQAGQKTGEKGKGPATLRQVVTATLGVPIHYFLRLDFDGFRKGVDAIGGIDINVKTAIVDPFYPNGKGGHTTFSVKAGEQHMNGEVALKYARSRQTTSDFDRARRQQEIVSAMKDKLLTPQILANPKKTLDLISIAGNHILTDFSATDLNSAVELAKDIPRPTVRSQVLDNSEALGLLSTSTSNAGAYILVPALGPDNFNSIEAFAQGYFAAPRILAEATTIELVDGGLGPTALAKVAQQLEWAGFTITTSTKSVLATKSVLVDYTKASPDSLSFIKSRYATSAISAASHETITTDLVLTAAADWPTFGKPASKK